MSIDTVISTYNQIDELILAGYKRAGLVPIEFGIGSDTQWAAKAAHGRATLNNLLNHIAVHGFLDHFTQFFILELTEGTSVYDIDPDENLLNLVDQGSYIPEANDPEEVETTGETPVKPITRHRWNQMSTKDAVGLPTLYYLHRNGPNLRVYLWPIPHEDGKIRFQAHRIPFSNSVGSNNPDVQRHWDLWLVNALAFEFMADSKLPLEERMLIKAERDNQMALIKAYETSNEAPDVVFCHTTPWSNF
jgi:hypothetical protein